MPYYEKILAYLVSCVLAVEKSERGLYAKPNTERSQTSLSEKFHILFCWPPFLKATKHLSVGANLGMNVPGSLP